MKATDLLKVLKDEGWREERRVGSHVVLKHYENPFNISVPVHGKKDLPPGTLNQILKKAGLK